MVGAVPIRPRAWGLFTRSSASVSQLPLFAAALQPIHPRQRVAQRPIRTEAAHEGAIQLHAAVGLEIASNWRDRRGQFATLLHQSCWGAPYMMLACSLDEPSLPRVGRVSSSWSLAIGAPPSFHAPDNSSCVPEPFSAHSIRVALPDVALCQPIPSLFPAI